MSNTPAKTDKRRDRTNAERIGQPSKAARGSGPVFEIRTSAKLTQREFADATEVPYRTIQNAERAGIWPQSKLAQKAIQDFARERGVSPASIA